MKLLLAKVLVKDIEANRYLILRSSVWPENPRRSLKPDLPGGVIEAGETTPTGLLRELQEETGIVASADNLTLIMQVEESHDSKDYERSLYLYETSSPKVVLSWEHDKYWWMSADEILALDIRAPYPDFFKKLREQNLLS
ncbi:MAG TPA: NUDIX hydrolase [Candidatus Saccharimonadales bacterium]